jgi:voltage-gated potassium channel
MAKVTQKVSKAAGAGLKKVVPRSVPRFSLRRDVPMTLAAVAFLAAYAWPILDPGLEQEWVALCRSVTAATWLVFVVDYVIRFVGAEHRWQFVRQHPLDLAIVVLPILQPLRLLQLLTLLSVLNRYAGGSLRGRVALYVAGASSIVMFVASLAVLDAERGAPDANIGGFADALWWAMTTVTTVGYGDHFPVTTTGRFVAAGLMLAGIALLGVVTASFASWLLDRVQDIEDDAGQATHGDIKALVDEVAALRRELTEARGTAGGPDSSAPASPRG